MLKRLLSIPLVFFTVFTASAQFQYNFKDTTTAYSPLTGGTSMNGSLIWDDEILFAPMPFTWTMNGNMTTNFYFLVLEVPATFVDTTDFSNVNGFILADADLADRGSLSGSSSLSPIRYQTTGTAPDRIFKLELANAGFFEELFNHSTMNDMVNVQMWVYETSNIVEYHYGPSQITNPGEYFSNGIGPVLGYAKDVDGDLGTSGDIYFLTGSSSSPTLDSTTLPLTNPPSGLSAWPANGKVYRFSPKKTIGVGVPNTPTNNIAVSVFPSVTSSYLNINYTPNANEAAEYQICALTGAVIKTGELRTGVQRIDVSAFAAGTYYMQVKSDKGTGVYRFMKQ